MLGYASSTLDNLTATSWDKLDISIRHAESDKMEHSEFLIANKLRYHRLLDGISRNELVRKLDLPLSIVISIEVRHIYPSREVSKKLAAYFKLDTKYFYDQFYEEELDIATYIKEYRQKNKLTLKRFGELVNATAETIKFWESNKTQIKRENYFKLKELGILP